MIAIDWLFIGGAGSIVGAAIIEKFADDFGYTWVGALFRIVFPIASICAGLFLCDVIAAVFLK